MSTAWGCRECSPRYVTALDSSGRPQHHPIDDTLSALTSWRCAVAPDCSTASGPGVDDADQGVAGQGVGDGRHGPDGQVPPARRGGDGVHEHAGADRGEVQRPGVDRVAAVQRERDAEAGDDQGGGVGDRGLQSGDHRQVADRVYHPVLGGKALGRRGRRQDAQPSAGVTKPPARPVPVTTRQDDGWTYRDVPARVTPSYQDVGSRDRARAFRSTGHLHGGRGELSSRGLSRHARTGARGKRRTFAAVGGAVRLDPDAVVLVLRRARPTQLGKISAATDDRCASMARTGLAGRTWIRSTAPVPPSAKAAATRPRSQQML